MTNHNDYRDDYKNPRGDYPPPGGAGLADSYYSEASGGHQQQQQQNQPPPYGYNPQGDSRGRDDRRDDRRDEYNQRDDRRDDDRRDDYNRRDDRRDDFNSPDGPDGERGVMGALAGGAAGAYGGHALGGKTGHSKTSGVVGALVGAFAGHKLQDTASDWKDERDEEKEEKKKRKEKEERRDDDKDDHGRRRRSRSRSRSSSRSSRSSSRHRRRDSGPRSGHYAGHFTATSRDIRLDTHGDYSLTASCKRNDGSYQSSTISLDKILENDGGSFRWASSGGHARGPQSVTVQHGDTLRGIGAKFGCSFEDISRHNGITNPDLIYPGQVLQIPGGSGGGGGGRFSSSAKHVRLLDGGQRLEAELRRDNGDWVMSSIVLDERIKNDNGTLELV